MLKIVIVEDHQMVRQGLRTLIDGEMGLTVVAETGDGLDALDLIREHRPDIAIVDLTLPSLNGLEVIRRIHQDAGPTRSIVLSMHTSETYITAALRNGAMGYVLKDEAAGELLEAIRQVETGRRFLSPSLPDALIDTYTTTAPPEAIEDRYETLTEREREVLHLLAEGYSGPEAAERLFISPRTVDSHRANLMRKLGLHTQTDLVHYAVQRGLVEPRPRTRGDDD